MINNVIKLSQNDIKFRKRATFSDKVARAATFPHPGHKMFAAPGGENFAAGARKSCPGRAGRCRKIQIQNLGATAPKF